MATSDGMSEQYGKLDDRYRARLDAGACVYEQGTVTGDLYLVLSGRVVFEVVDAGGARAVVHEAGAEEWFGHVSASRVAPPPPVRRCWSRPSC